MEIGGVLASSAFISSSGILLTTKEKDKWKRIFFNL